MTAMYPATLEEMKTYCRVDHDFENSLFTDVYAPSALQYMADATGLSYDELTGNPECRQPFLMLVRANFAPDDNAHQYQERADRLLWPMSIKHRKAQQVN